ncbi:hypothetical protein AGMMS49959_06410 [Planctomycetales bacterium]|nr:hypothetical protein AGMMS49959_06410 [Planctomycetales bacterium]
MVVCCVVCRRSASVSATDNRTVKDACRWTRGIVNAGYYNVVTGGSGIASYVSGCAKKRGGGWTWGAAGAYNISRKRRAAAQ